MVAQIRTPKPTESELAKSNKPKTDPLDATLTIVENPISSKSESNSSSFTQEIFYWRKTDSLRFVVQITLTLVVLFFCIGKLTANEDETDKALYWGGVMSLMAWWMPSPGGTTGSKSGK
ncbi:MAG: hypothetical protein NW224_09850 [Leptolyngbyaceae cyanobacterium bins.302]|nr:hypothetical protein [Leptolyngbyaceae cyanobacterium bins.302]